MQKFPEDNKAGDEEFRGDNFILVLHCSCILLLVSLHHCSDISIFSSNFAVSVSFVLLKCNWTFHQFAHNYFDCNADSTFFHIWTQCVLQNQHFSQLNTMLDLLPPITNLLLVNKNVNSWQLQNHLLLHKNIVKFSQFFSYLLFWWRWCHHYLFIQICF